MPGLRNIEEYMDLIKDLGVEVYKDAARPAVSEVGAVAGRTVKALLAPIRGFLWCWEKIEDYVEKEVQKPLDIEVGGGAVKSTHDFLQVILFFFPVVESHFC